jgi:hypothetical protein
MNIALDSLWRLQPFPMIVDTTPTKPTVRLDRSHRSDESYRPESHAFRALGGDARFDNPRTHQPLTSLAKYLAAAPQRAKSAPQYRVKGEIGSYQII